jgi:hypothetical protein
VLITCGTRVDRPEDPLRKPDLVAANLAEVARLILEADAASGAKA